MRPLWRWYVRGFYSDKAEPPREPGKLAIEISGVSKEALAMDIKVLEEREDIGNIVVGQWDVPR